MKTFSFTKVLFIVIIASFFCTPMLKAAEPETLLGISFDYDKQEVTITVSSSGCTQKQDFQFIVKGNQLTINRTKPDFCKAMESPVSFTYTLKETGIEPNKALNITNKFIVNPYIARIQKAPTK
jgi:hypothetical protein